MFMKSPRGKKTQWKLYLFVHSYDCGDNYNKCSLLS